MNATYQPTENPIVDDEKAQRFIRWALDQKGITTDVADLVWTPEVDSAITLGTYQVGRDDSLRFTAEMYRRWLKGGY